MTGVATRQVSALAQLQQTNTVKYFTNTSLKMLINLAILAALFMPSIMAARLSQEDMAKTLISGKEDLVQTFKKFESEQDKYELSHALANVARVPEHIPKVATCLRTVDPFPKEMSNVSWLIHSTLYNIFYDTRGGTEFFAKVIASFEPSDIKPLASIRHLTLLRDDAVKVVESVMAKSSEPITGDLSRWLANHSFDRKSLNYTDYRVARKQTFQYLTLFATERVLNDALSIVKANGHYKIDSNAWCCKSQDSFPQDLYNKLSVLLAFVKARNALINAVLPTVLVNMVADYLPPSTD